MTDVAVERAKTVYLVEVINDTMCGESLPWEVFLVFLSLAVPDPLVISPQSCVEYSTDLFTSVGSNTHHSNWTNSQSTE
jgi:hypothetical protein